MRATLRFTQSCSSAASNLASLDPRGVFNLALATLIATSGIAIAGPVRFYGVGDLPGGRFTSSFIRGLSGDGGTAVGSSSGIGGDAMAWTESSGIIQLTPLDPNHSLVANGVSRDAGVIVGRSNNSAVAWIGGQPSVLASHPSWDSSSALAVNDDGRVIVGHSNNLSTSRPVVWYLDGGAVELPLPPGAIAGEVRSVSGDGRVMCGLARIGSSVPTRAVIWDVSGEVHDLPGAHPTSSTAVNLSHDGQVAVGVSDSRAVVWHGLDSMEELPVVSGTMWSAAVDVSADHHVIVGWMQPSPTVVRYAMWVGPDREIVFIDDYLQSRGVDLTGWQFDQITSVSEDGRVIAGNGYSPLGDREGWVAFIGAPCDADISGSSDPNDPAYGVADGRADSADFFYFLDQFVANNLAVADLTGSLDPNDPDYGVPDGIIDAADFFYYLDQFVAGCA